MSIIPISHRRLVVFEYCVVEYLARDFASPEPPQEKPFVTESLFENLDIVSKEYYHAFFAIQKNVEPSEITTPIEGSTNYWNQVRTSLSSLILSKLISVQLPFVILDREITVNYEGSSLWADEIFEMLNHISQLFDRIDMYVANQSCCRYYESLCNQAVNFGLHIHFVGQKTPPKLI